MWPVLTKGVDFITFWDIAAVRKFTKTQYNFIYLNQACIIKYLTVLVSWNRIVSQVEDMVSEYLSPCSSYSFFKLFYYYYFIFYYYCKARCVRTFCASYRAIQDFCIIIIIIIKTTGFLLRCCRLLNQCTPTASLYGTSGFSLHPTNLTAISILPRPVTMPCLFYICWSTPVILV